MLVRWIVGLTFALAFGRVVPPLFLWLLRKNSDYEGHGDVLVPPWVTGMIESIFFTVAVAFMLPGVTVAMIAWIAAKMAAHWERKENVEDIVGLRFSALLGSMINLFFATIGGLICGGYIWFG